MKKELEEKVKAMEQEVNILQANETYKKYFEYDIKKQKIPKKDISDKEMEIYMAKAKERLSKWGETKKRRIEKINKIHEVPEKEKQILRNMEENYQEFEKERKKKLQVNSIIFFF